MHPEVAAADIDDIDPQGVLRGAPRKDGRRRFSAEVYDDNGFLYAIGAFPDKKTAAGVADQLVAAIGNSVARRNYVTASATVNSSSRSINSASNAAMSPLVT